MDASLRLCTLHVHAASVHWDTSCTFTVLVQWWRKGVYTIHPLCPIVHTTGGGKGCTLQVHIAGGGKKYPLDVHSSGGGKGCTLHVYTAGKGNGYTLRVHTAGGENVLYTLHVHTAGGIKGYTLHVHFCPYFWR
jgi:hypothetical protein